MTRSFLPGRQLALVAGALLFAVANLVFFLAYRSGSHTRRAALEARRAELAKGVEAAEAGAARASSQQDRLGGVSAAIEEFYGKRIGTERETLALVVDEIHSILKETGVAANQISYATVSSQKLPLAQMRIVFTVHCDYGRFKKLLQAFESSRRWIAVRDVAITREPDKPGSVQVQLELVTYFAEGGEGRSEAPEKPAPSAGKGALPARKAG